MDITSGVVSLPNKSSFHRYEAGRGRRWSAALLLLGAASVSPQLLVFQGILGQVLFPLNFNQLVQLHGGLGIFHRGMSTFPNLYVPV